MDHVSIAFERLEAALTGQLETLYPLTDDCCIYRVPPKIRMHNESFYTPKVVSFGPFHHGRNELQAMEKHKLRYLQQFLQRTHVSMNEFLIFISSKEAYLRNCYEETHYFSSEEFVIMILLDAVFLIGTLQRCVSEFLCVDCIFSSVGIIKHIAFDMMLLENQIPIFILVELFNLANLAVPDQCYSLCQLTHLFFKYFICQDMLMDETLLESHFSEAKHFVDLLKLCLLPPPRPKRGADFEAISRVTTLQHYGIKFELAPTNCLLDIRFDNGILKIPKLTIGNMTEHLLRNLQIYEALHCDTNYINDYSMVLNRLLSTPKDVKLLTKVGVIENKIFDSEGLSTLFGELSRDARVQYSNFHYSDLVEDLIYYCKSPWRMWKATLMRRYFSNPWAFIAITEILVMLILTLIQTVCSVFGLRN